MLTLNALGRELFAQVSRSVFPILGSTDRGKFFVVGTCILTIDQNEKAYLITAAHVLETWGKRPLYISLDKKTLELSFRALKSKPATPGSDDSLDIAIFPIPSQEASSFIGYDALPLYKPLGVNDKGSIFMFSYGYPSSQSDVDILRKGVVLKPLQYFGREITDFKIFTKLKYDITLHVLMKYLKRKSKIIGVKNYVIAPKPKGVSGGPIFRCYRNVKSNEWIFVFCGVLTEFSYESAQVMKATKIEAIYPMLKIVSDSPCLFS